MGYIPNVMLTWKSRSQSCEYHDKMNTDNFLKVTSEKLIPNLPSNSVIVVDDAPYQNTLIDKAQKPNFKKKKKKI